MTYEEATIVVNRMEDDSRRKFDGQKGYENSYVLGAVLEKIRFLLATSNLKFSDFKDNGDYKWPNEKK